VAAPHRVLFSRGGLRESAHRLVWVVTGPDGEVLAESEPDDAEVGVFPRSAVKPLQALPSVRAGTLERFGFEPRHLALGCASHGGDSRHVEVVTEMLAAAGLNESHLLCGPLDPRDPAAADALRRGGAMPARITHNCSGKHALALARTVMEGWPLGTYVDSGHPVQRAMHASVAAAADLAPAQVPFGADGCGMLAFQLPIGKLAAAFGKLASGGLGESGDRIAAAMTEHPELVAFDGALDTELMRAHEGLVAKIGAEGVLGVGLPDGRGMALKVADGAMRALDPAGVGLVREALGLTVSGDAIDALAQPVLTNSRGLAVGAGRAVG
jgi:L-asparaginase II